MKYNILDTSLESALANGCNIPDFAAKVLASYDMDVIKDILDYQEREVIFETMNDAIALIKKHIDKQSKIVIMGDYDCDGILATSILVKAFKQCNVNVGYYIPNRISDGYGINKDIVQQFIDKDYNLIITVDNGINAREAIEFALDANIDVIVSDHHAVEKDMQVKEAIYVHPTFSNLDYYISGGVVAYYLAYNLLEREDLYLHSLAAITLISDVMPLVKGNRLFLRKALSNMQKLKFPTITQLASGFIDSSMIGTVIAPKINSLGRLPDVYNPNKLVRYFCSENLSQIKTFAIEIEECNNVRKKMTSEYYNHYTNVPINNNFLMIEEEGLHEGLIGLLASRFSNQYNCVTLVATKTETGYKGSVRSISNLNAYDVFIKHSELFDKFGGHAQAMGLSYSSENSEMIRKKLSADFKNIELEDKEYNVIKLKESDITLSNVKTLRYLEPFGSSFEAPLFLFENVLVAGIKHLKGNIHHRLSVLLDTKAFDVMIFNTSDLDIVVNNHVDLIVKLGVNEFYGKEKLNIIVEDYKIK